ncbi:MAG: hypothetical protein O2955_11720 [Planctomycetota bacterium]|nr:hypothetical protein [Planctomycetota bacterium]MDA1213178.1 hypothetical protein [Planctomycetota bacterium]
MKLSHFHVRLAFALLVGGVVPFAMTGCQTTVGGQTLPSGYYLTDDVQYFPAGPEFKLTNEEQAIKSYQQQQDTDASAP